MTLENLDIDDSLEAVQRAAYNFVDEIREKASHYSPVFEKRNTPYYIETCTWNLVTLFYESTYHMEKVITEIQEDIESLHSKTNIEDARNTSNRIMRSFLENWLEKSKDPDTEFKLIAGPEFKMPKSFQQTLRMNVDSGPVLFTFNAFLFSSRSALDFAAKIIGGYVKGTNFRSIHRLHNSLEKNHPNLIISRFLISEWKRWISLLKSYRDAITHNIVLNFSASRELRYEQDNVTDGSDLQPSSDNLLGFYIYRVPPPFHYKVKGMEEFFEPELPIIETNVGVTLNLSNGVSQTANRSIKRVDNTKVMPLQEYVIKTHRDLQGFILKTLSILIKQKGQYFV